MKKKSLNPLKNQTISFLITFILLAFLVIITITFSFFNYSSHNNHTQIISIASEKKRIELNSYFNAAEKIVNEFEDYIQLTLDEDKLLTDSEYEEFYMTRLSRFMTSRASLQKGVICTFFRMNIDKFGPTRGIFLTGNYQKKFVNIRTTDLSKYSPSDIEHVGWYYLPVWKKEAIWTPPYENVSLGQWMISYSLPIYKNGFFIGVVGIDLRLGIIDEMINSIPIDNAKGLLIGRENNLIHMNTPEELTKAVDRSTELSLILEQFENEKKKVIQNFIWDGKSYTGTLSKLDNGMSYITAVPRKEILKTVYGQINILIISFLIIFILITNLILFISKKVISPIKIVSRTTNRLARGELSIDIPYRSDNEIGSLANNIRLMTSQLKEYIEYISAQTKKEREAKEAALTESQINAAASQAKSAFLANMSHEIRTPINAVLGMNEMILRESKDKTILGYALNIKNAGSNLLSIVNDVLDFSKIEAGKMELLPDNYEISSVIIDLVNMTRERAQKKGLKFELNISTDIPKTLYGDSVRIKQCILNLLTNAIKYTKEGTITFSIDYSKIDDNNIFLNVHVKDTGSGIKQEDMEKLFAPFERIEEDKNRTIEGSGLGISIVRRLLDMMGSKLQVNSVYGKGSDFSFSIEQSVIDWAATGDLNEAYEESIEQLENYKEKLHAPKARLLFVDDTEINLEVIKGLLKNTGITIDTLLSGKEALEAVQKYKYDILFIDHRMPEMDGIQTLHAMKELKNNKSAGKPCIVLTANAISGVKKMYLNEGFDDYLSKPVNAVKLEEMIRNYLPKEYIEENPDVSENLTKDTSEKYDIFLEKLSKIPELDVKAGLENCTSAEILLSTIKQYYSSIDNKALEIQKYFDEEDWKNYGTKVHALKSTSRLIGALELSKLAEHLEDCAENNTEEIKKRNKELLDFYKNYKFILKPLVDDDSQINNKPEISIELLSEKINQAIEYANTFDIDSLDNLIKEIREFSLPFEFSQKFDKIIESVENVDFKQLRILLSEWSSK